MFLRASQDRRPSGNADVASPCPGRPNGSTVQGLTPRSSRAPTAGHQARSGGTRYIFTSPGLASHRRCQLCSNVRPRKSNTVATPPLFRNPARAPRGNSVLSPLWPHHGFQRERSEFQSRSQQGQSRALPATGQASRSIVPRGDLKAALLCRHPRREASGRARLRGTMASKHRTVQGLTPQSSGAPTAGHQGPACGTWCIITARALASYRCRPLTSNVRPHTKTPREPPARFGN